MTVSDHVIEPGTPRLFPELTFANRSYWTGGADGQLHMPRCRDCRRWSAVGLLTCDVCGGPTDPEVVSGRGRVFTYTLNAHQFHPDIPAPNLIAVVELEEQADLRLATNLVDCDVADIKIGMAVTVVFEHHGEIFYPVFRPDAAQRETGDE